MAKTVFLSDRFYDAPEILEAERHSRLAVGLYVRTLFGLQRLHYDDYTEYIASYGMFWDYLTETKQPGRVTNALVKAGLWEPLRRDNGQVVRGAWIIVQNGLWKIYHGVYREPISAELRQTVIERDGMVCQLCGGEVMGRRDLHLDHIYPVSKGGRSTLENLQVAHARCNMSKGARVA